MFKRSSATKPIKVVAYNTPIFALYCFLEMDTQRGEYLLEMLSQFDVENNQTVLVNEFALKFAGKQHHAFVALFLLFRHSFEDLEKGKGLQIEYHHRIIMETLSHVIHPCFTPFFQFLCFLFHLITIEDTDYLEYIYWLLTKGERTLDRGEVATLLQVILMENKDSFVAKYKLTIERLLVDEGSEAIVLNRFQIINASLGGVFTRCMTDLQLALQSSLNLGSYWQILTKKLYSALYINSDAAYDNLKHWRNLAVNNDILLERKRARKLIRTFLRLMKSYRTLRDNTTLLFKNNGFNMSKMMVKLAQKLVETIQRHDEHEPQMEAKLDSSTGEVRMMVVKASKDSEQSKNAFAIMMKKLLPAWMQATAQETVFQVKEEEVDPFAFEKRLTYTLTTPIDELLETAKLTRENALDILDETESMMAELNAMDITLANMSEKFMTSFKGMTSEKRREEEELMMYAGKSRKSEKSSKVHVGDNNSQGSNERGGGVNRRHVSRASASRRSRSLSRSASKSHDSLEDSLSNSSNSHLAQRRKSLQHIKEESFKRMSSGILSAASHNSDSDGHGSPSSKGSRSSSSRSLKSSFSRSKSMRRQGSSKTDGPITEGDEEDEKEDSGEDDEGNRDEISEYNELDEVEEEDDD